MSYAEFTNDNWRVVAEYIGEGNSGDYDESDPDDQPLMRYDFFQVRNLDTHLSEDDDLLEEAVDSYCTLIPETDDAAIEGMGRIFLDALGNSSLFPKRRIQELTWTTPEEAKAILKVGGG